MGWIAGINTHNRAESVRSRSWIHSVPRPWTLVLAFVALAFAAGPCSAKPETRAIAWTWTVYGGSVGDYTTPSAPIDAWNQGVDAGFQQCVAAMKMCGSCSKSNKYIPTGQIGGFGAVINGQPTVLWTTQNIVTTTTAACYSTPGRTDVTDMSQTGQIAVAATFSCPQETGFKANSGNGRYVTVQGVQTTAYDLWCERDIPDPSAQVCKPRLGDPINPVDRTQVESELDYSSADGLLRIRRDYSSAGGGKWTWGDLSTNLVDFSGGRTGPLPMSTAFTGTIKAVPPGYYYYPAPGRPPAVNTPRSFPLIKSQPDTGQAEVWFTGADGTRTVFKQTAPGVYATASPNGLQLSAQLMLRDANSYLMFDGNGDLQARMFADGRSLALTADGGGRRITALPGGRSILYRTDAATGRYLATLPDGSVIAYVIDPSSAITSVTFPDASSKTFIYNEPANIGTTSPSPLLLTGFVDENSVRQATFKYQAGNAISTERVGGVDKYSVTSPYDGVSLVVEPTSTSQFSFNWTTGPDGERQLTSQGQPAGSGCNAASSNITYDTHGNVASRTDFDNNVTCYSADPVRSLEGVRVEGVPVGYTCASLTPPAAALVAGSRKITTRWHPDWSFKTSIAAPEKLTTFVYNGQPDPSSGNAAAVCAPMDALLPDGKPIAVLCKQIEQATTDSSGALGFAAAADTSAPRQRSWTYNRYGQVLTAKGPRSDVNDTTTYAYYADTTASHTSGDLASTTNPAGQVTQFVSYDAHGNVLQMVAPNGVKTSYAYDLRQRLVSTSDGGRLTTYRYDPAGQLVQIGLPNATQMTLTYDPAHRLTQITDQAGNSVTYTLDNAGNRVQEQVKDPSGVLSRSVGRVFDALGRAQQVTGAAQ